ncbi:MAG TPA: KH domain-containing protein [Candidatus Saccharimonadia bacterium]|nr:KH domain-containing protein [Candidatus Saccharimonadia bacterium]
MTTSIDQQFVEFIVKSLVNNPDAVKIDRRIDEKGVLLELTVDAEDLGRVIGKRGATAQSLRTLLRALGTKNEARYNLKIVDVDRPEGDRGTSYSTTTSTSDDDDDTTDAQSVSGSENDAVARTRKELADLDDLDI